LKTEVISLYYFTL